MRPRTSVRLAGQTQTSVCLSLKRFVQMDLHHVPFEFDSSDEFGDRRSGPCSRLHQSPAKPSFPRSATDHNESNVIYQLHKTDPPLFSVEGSLFCPESLSSLVPPSPLLSQHPISLLISTKKAISSASVAHLPYTSECLPNFSPRAALSVQFLNPSWRAHNQYIP